MPAAGVIIIYNMISVGYMTMEKPSRRGRVQIDRQAACGYQNDMNSLGKGDAVPLSDLEGEVACQPSQADDTLRGGAGFWPHRHGQQYEGKWMDEPDQSKGPRRFSSAEMVRGGTGPPFTGGANPKKIKLTPFENRRINTSSNKIAVRGMH
jgi:hypothetical protein